jgi:hypothetical protein
MKESGMKDILQKPVHLYSAIIVIFIYLQAEVAILWPDYG